MTERLLVITACASSAEKLQACEVQYAPSRQAPPFFFFALRDCLRLQAAGASILINYETDAGGDFKQALKDADVYPLIDVVLDPVGGKWSETGVRSLVCFHV